MCSFFYFVLIDLCKICILCPRIILGTFFHFILFRNLIILNFLNICLLVQCFCRACRVQRRSGEKTSHIETIITKRIKFSPLQAESRIVLLRSSDDGAFDRQSKSPGLDTQRSGRVPFFTEKIV